MPITSTFLNIPETARDFWQGWKTAKDEAVDRFNRAVEIDEKQNLDQSVGDPDKVYASQAPMVGLGGLASVALYPMGFAISRAIPGADKILPYADLSHTGSLLQKEFWTNPNYKYVDHTYDELGAPAMTDVARWIATPVAMKGAAKGAKSYAKGVSGRVKAVEEAGKRPTVDQSLANIYDRENFIIRDTKDGSGRIIFAMSPEEATRYHRILRSGERKPSVGILKQEFGEPTLELHMNPEFSVKSDGQLDVVQNGSKAHQVHAARLISALPDGTQLSQDASSVSVPTYLARYSSPWTRGLYYLTGKEPSVKPTITRGYSSSVPDAMFRNAAKGRGTVEKSITTRSGSTNLLGDNSQILREIFGDYITRNKSGFEEIIFKNVPKELIKKWNETYGEKLHMHIDPKTKTMDNWIYVKGSRTKK